MVIAAQRTQCGRGNTSQMYADAAIQKLGMAVVVVEVLVVVVIVSVNEYSLSR